MTKICCISDTHGKHDLLSIPKCDILLCAGDFNLQNEWDLDRLNFWFGTLKENVDIIIFIGGNHDHILEKLEKQYIDAIFTNATYLQDSFVTIDNIKVYGTPWSPIFQSWAFMDTHDFLKENREKIPLDTDILLSHCPPYGIMDHVSMVNGDRGRSQGCVPLLNKVKLIKPKLHVFGHIHEGHGKYTDYSTDYVNASIMDEYYNPVNSPLLVEI